MRYEIRYCCASHRGCSRAQNEDNFFLPGRMPLPALPDELEPVSGLLPSEEAPVFAVFDGMGGGQQGETAAFIAAETAAQFSFLGRDALEEYCLEANRRVCAEGEARGYASMGATCALARLDGDGVHACGLGDSRALRWRDGQLRQLTRDHAMAMPGSRKPMLTQYLGIPEDELHLEPSRADLDLLPGDRVLLCTDGLTDRVDAPTISAVLSAGAETAARLLLRLALEAGGQDDVTLIVCAVEGKDSPS